MTAICANIRLSEGRANMPLSTTGKTNKLALAGYYAFKALPILISGVAIYLGYDLFIRGVTGEASLSIQSHTVSGQLINAAPGLFFAIGGLAALIVIIRTGAEVKHDSSDPPS